MKSYQLIVVCILSIIWIESLYAKVDKDPYGDLINQVKVEMEKIAKAKAEKKGGVSYKKSSIEFLIKKLRDELKSNNFYNPPRTLSNIETQFVSEEVSILCQKIRELVETEKLRQNKEMVNRIDAILSEVNKTCLNAKNTAEIDPLITKIKEIDYQSKNNLNWNDTTKNRFDRLKFGLKLVTKWQEYLSYLNNGEPAKAKKELKRLSDDSSFFPIVPRSEILSRINISEKKETVSNNNMPSSKGDFDLKSHIPALNKPDDISAVLKKLSILKKEHPKNSAIRSLISELKTIDEACSNYQSGFYNLAFRKAISTYYSNPGHDVNLDKLKANMLELIIPMKLGSKEIAKPKEGEIPPEYILRIAEDAKNQKNWKLLRSALSIYRDVAFSGGKPPAWLSDDLDGINAFMVALNLYEAKQYLNSAYSLQRALTFSGKYLPIQEIKIHLEKIKKVDPTAYEKATSLESANE